MKGITSYKLRVVVMSPDMTKKKELRLIANIVKWNSRNGDVTYLRIEDNEYEFEESIKLDNSRKFDADRPEKFIADWAYDYWSCSNGSWNICELEIKAVGVRKKTVK